jgi:hypothetical protein
MADEKLKPEDFPVHPGQKKIVNNDGKTIAEASDKTVAEDIAERRQTKTNANKTVGRHNNSP